MEGSDGGVRRRGETAVPQRRSEPGRLTCRTVLAAEGPAPVLLLLPAAGVWPGSGEVGGPDQEGEDLKGTGSINDEFRIKLIQEISTFSI